MERRCYFCHKPLPIEKRAEMFCSLRCQALQRQLSGEGPTAHRPGSPAGQPRTRPPQRRKQA